jgi:hypothetical protein
MVEGGRGKRGVDVATCPTDLGTIFEVAFINMLC